MDVEGPSDPKLLNRNEFSPESSSNRHLYEAYNRPPRDLGVAIGYLSLLALSVFWGIAAFTHTDPSYGDYTSDFMWNSTTCSVAQYKAAVPQVDLEQLDATFAKAFGRAVSTWLPISVAAGIALSVVYVLLFRKFAYPMVKITVTVPLVFLYLISFIALATGGIVIGIIFLIIAILLSVLFWWIRNDLQTCARLLTVAGRGLNENFMLIPTVIGLKLGGVAVMGYLLAAFISAMYVGELKPSPDVLQRDQSEVGTCYDALGTVTPCCTFETRTWASAYAFFNMVTLCWTGTLVMQIKLYVVADTLSQWYFAAASGSGARPSIRQALSHCFKSSFGSVAFAAAVLTLIQMLRESLRRASRENVVCCIINCIAQPILALCEEFTNFATIAVAITGKTFVQASKDIFGVLKRNFLATYNLWWIPDMVLGVAVLLMSLAWFGIVFMATLAQAPSLEDDQLDQQGLVAFVVALLCFITICYILNFIASVLLDIVNTIYICYSMDKDCQHVTMPEIHAIYEEIPTLKGAVIQNPDGNVLYGAPEPERQPQPQGYAYASPYNAPGTATWGAHPPPPPAFGGPAPPAYPAASPYPAVNHPAGYPPQQQSYPYGYGNNNV